MARNRLPFVQRRTLADGSPRYRGWAQRAGKRIFTDSYDTEDDAYRAALALRRAAGDGIAGESLDDACEHVIDEVRDKRTAGSRRWYQEHLRAVRRLIPGETDLTRITSATIEQYIRDRLAGVKGRKVKPATVNADLRALHRVFAVAIRRGVVRQNPVHHVDRPREDRPPMDWFTDAELRKLLAKVPQHQRDVLLLFALTGVRRSEAARLEPGHVRFRLGQIVVPGKNATRVVPIAPDLEAPLRRLMARAGEHLLPGGTHAIDDLFRAVRDIVKDRRMHPHALRHTFGTALIRSTAGPDGKTVRPDVVMRLMGHRSITTTLRYVHEVGMDGVQAVAGLRLAPDPASDERRAD